MLLLNIQDKWLQKIIAGAKKVEGRKYKKEYAEAVGQIIMLKSSTDTIEVKVVDVRCYPSIEIYLRAEGFSNVLPGVATFEEALHIYRDFQHADPDVADEMIKRAGGIVAMEIERV